MVATNNNGEPSPFSLNNDCIGGYGVASDSFSFWDQTSDDLSAKGNGGMRQLYNYATIDSNMRIEAPKEDYAPDKIGTVSLENLQQQRNTEIQFNAEKQAKAVEHPSQQQFIQQQQQKQQFQSQFSQQQQFQQQIQTMGPQVAQQQEQQRQQQKNVRFS
jgi:hypothetical protein